MLFLYVFQDDGSVFVSGLREVRPSSLAEALALLQRGQANRQVACTSLNKGILHIFISLVFILKITHGYFIEFYCFSFLVLQSHRVRTVF